ncbi:MAG: hypothetical protein WBF67_11000 [Olleya sp.]
MKNIFKILILVLILASCAKEKKDEKITAKSLFNLNNDLTDFRKKMTELDTIKIWVDHSVCTYQGDERIKITKKLDSIKIRTEYREDYTGKDSKWEFVYEKKIPVTDTLWDIENFFKRNMKRQEKIEDNYPKLIVSHNGIKLNYFTKSLGDLNSFMTDYSATMRKLYPENRNGIYGVDVEFKDEIN